MRVDDIVHIVTSVGSIAARETLEGNPLVDFMELEIYLVYNTVSVHSLQNCRIFQFGVALG